MTRCVNSEWLVDHPIPDIEANYLKTLDLAPQLAERIRAGHREERFYGTADLVNFFREPYGPGWALVGDAGLTMDLYKARGISSAFRDSEYLTEAIDDGFSGRRPLDDALSAANRRTHVGAGDEAQSRVVYPQLSRWRPYLILRP